MHYLTYLKLLVPMLKIHRNVNICITIFLGHNPAFFQQQGEITNYENVLFNSFKCVSNSANKFTGLLVLRPISTNVRITSFPR